MGQVNEADKYIYIYTLYIYILYIQVLYIYIYRDYILLESDSFPVASPVPGRACSAEGRHSRHIKHQMSHRTHDGGLGWGGWGWGWRPLLVALVSHLAVGDSRDSSLWCRSLCFTAVRALGVRLGDTWHLPTLQGGLRQAVRLIGRIGRGPRWS